MEKYRGLIFDFNGVLLLDQPLHDRIWSQIAVGIRGKELTEDEIRKLFHGRTNKSVLEYLLGRTIEGDELETWITKKESQYQEVAKQLGSEYRLSLGATELLDALKARNIPFTIATSSPKMNVDFFNKVLHLDRWFDMTKVVHDDNTFPSKPAPDIYLRAAEKLSLKPEDCVVIEDARSGIASAHAAGIGHIIAIGPKESHESLRKIMGVSEIIETLDQVNVATLFG